MKKYSLKKLTFAAVYAALIYVATMVIHIPIPSLGGGYINAGDAFVILAGTVIGGVYGGPAAAIGSAFADLTLGYIIYIPATFFIKGLMAFTVSLILIKPKPSSLRFLFAAVTAELIMILGYFMFESFLYGIPAALVSAPMNCIQGIGGIIIAALLKTPLSKLNDRL